MNFAIVLILNIFLSIKAFNNSDVFHKFSINQKNKFNDYESEKEELFNINFEILFNIYSKTGLINKGYILLLNFSKNNNNLIKKIKKDKKDIIFIKEDINKLIPSKINIEDFEPPNYSLKKPLYCNLNKTLSKKLKFVNNYPLIKFIFTKNGILKIYRPYGLSDLDFFDIIHFLNQIILKNRNNSFENSDYKGDDSNKGNNFDEDEDEDIPFFPIKEYLRKKCENSQFIMKIFKEDFLGIKFIGKVSVFFYKNNTGKINFELYSKHLGNKKKLFSYDYIGSTEKIKDIIINKLGGLWDFIDNIINTFNDYYQSIFDKITSIIFYILQKFNTETIFKHPMKVCSNVLIEYKEEILKNSKDLFFNIISFLNENFIQLKDFILPLSKNLFDTMFNNMQFIKNINLGSFKEHLTKNRLYDKISETYEDIKNSEKTKNIINNIKYSKDKIAEISGNIFHKGINKIKDISKPKLDNAKSSCKETSNYFGNKLKGFFG